MKKNILITTLFLLCICIMMTASGCKGVEIVIQTKAPESDNNLPTEVQSSEPAGSMENNPQSEVSGISESGAVDTADTVPSQTPEGSAETSQTPAGSADIAISGTNNANTSSARTSSPKTSEPGTPKTSTATVTQTTIPKTSTPPVNTRRNLCAGWLTGMNINDKTKMYDWDKANKYITASRSLECSWGNGYGKSYLVDGKKASTALMFDMGAWISCTIVPGWGDLTGDIYEDSVTWKRANLNEWLIFDLQKVYTVDQVNLSALYKGAGRGFPTDFTIQVSQDKITWKTVQTEVNYDMDITVLDQEFKFSGERARYVKLNFTKGSTKPIDDNLAYCAAFSEIEIWGKE